SVEPKLLEQEAPCGGVFGTLFEHHRGRRQGARSNERGCVSGKDGKHTFAPMTRVGRADLTPGEAEGGDDYAGGDGVTGVERELERLGDVGVLLTEAGRGLALCDEELRQRMAREVLDPFQVTTGPRVACPGLTQPLCCILTDRFEETKTNTRTTGNTRQERTFDEPFEEIDDPSARDLGVGDDVFSGVRGKAC